MATGFSCREQIAQQTGRRALHPAQVLRMALRQGAEAPEEEPETGTARTVAWLAAGALLAGVAAWGLRKLRDRGEA